MRIRCLEGIGVENTDTVFVLPSSCTSKREKKSYNVGSKKHSPHRKGTTLVPGTVKLHHKQKERSRRGPARRVAGLT
jgi:hypothetical protein